MVGKPSMWKFACRSVKKLRKLDFTDFYYWAEQKIVTLVTSLFENAFRSVGRIVTQDCPCRNFMFLFSDWLSRPMRWWIRATQPSSTTSFAEPRTGNSNLRVHVLNSSAAALLSSKKKLFHKNSGQETILYIHVDDTYLVIVKVIFSACAEKKGVGMSINAITKNVASKNCCSCKLLTLR